MDKVQILILRNLLYNEEYLRKVIPFIKADYYEDSNQRIVFEEIDKHKKRQDLVGAQARKIIRIWDELRSKGCLQKGIRIRKGLGLVKAISRPNIEKSIIELD